MKRQTNYIVVPLNLWEHPDLTMSEKHLLIDLDSISGADGISVGTQALAAISGMSQKEVKNCLNELFLKGAITMNVNEDGEKIIKPLLWKERYIKRGDTLPILGDKPTDAAPLPYDEIMEEWNKTCSMLPKLTRWTPQRKNKLRSSMKQADIDLDKLYKCFKIVAATPFLNGSSDKFKCTFQWLVERSQNLSKVYEGFYSRTFQEKKDYEAILSGSSTTAKLDNDDSFYR